MTSPASHIESPAVLTVAEVRRVELVGRVRAAEESQPECGALPDDLPGGGPSVQHPDEEGDVRRVVRCADYGNRRGFQEWL